MHNTEYEQGRQDATNECAQRHITRIADVLDALHRHAGNIDQQHTAILDALRDGAR
ncbi:MAG TPA: hypothetical protein VK453_25235 [Micromonosporaceae bacterium]|nr:hypothetical protein [Micromonosporaceae bacterium]